MDSTRERERERDKTHRHTHSHLVLSPVLEESLIRPLVCALPRSRGPEPVAMVTPAGVGVRCVCGGGAFVRTCV